MRIDYLRVIQFYDIPIKHRKNKVAKIHPITFTDGTPTCSGITYGSPGNAYASEQYRVLIKA